MKGTDSTTAKQQYILFAQERLNIDELAKDSASSSSGAVIAIAALLGGGGVRAICFVFLLPQGLSFLTYCCVVVFFVLLSIQARRIETQKVCVYV